MSRVAMARAKEAGKEKKHSGYRRVSNPREGTRAWKSAWAFIYKHRSLSMEIHVFLLPEARK